VVIDGEAALLDILDTAGQVRDSYVYYDDENIAQKITRDIRINFYLIYMIRNDSLMLYIGGIHSHA